MGFKDYLIGILFSLLVALTLWLAYEIQPREETVKKTTDSSTTRTVDSTHAADTSRTLFPIIPSLPDTVVYSDTLIQTKTDTFEVKPDSQENSKYTKIREYETNISDTLISGTINTTVQGYLVDQNFTYTPEYPLQIKVNTNTTVTKTITKTLKPKGYPSIHVTAVSDLEVLRGIEVGGSWTFQNGNRIGYEYNPVAKTHGIRLSYNLRNIFRD